MTKKPSFFRIDEQVFFAMTGMCIIALIVLAFQYSNQETCSPIKITFSDSLVAGSIIRFKAETPGGKIFSWNFGDGSDKEEHSNTTTHIYKAAGSYTINVLVNEHCEETQTFFVKEAPVVANTSMLPIIESSSDTAYTGEPITVTDVSTISTSWEWFFGETNAVDKSTQEATYIYNTAGYKTIYLRVNGRSDLTRTKDIYVIDKESDKNKTVKPRLIAPKPAPVRPLIKDNPQVDKTLNEQIEEKKTDPIPETPKPKAPDVSTDELATMIKSIASGDKTAEVFNTYLCNNKDIKVAYNNTVLTLPKFCEALRELKKKKIKKISVWRNVNAQTNCIESMVVTIEAKKSIWPF